MQIRQALAIVFVWDRGVELEYDELLGFLVEDFAQLDFQAV